MYGYSELYMKTNIINSFSRMIKGCLTYIIRKKYLLRICIIKLQGYTYL